MYIHKKVAQVRLSHNMLPLVYSLAVPVTMLTTLTLYSGSLQVSGIHFNVAGCLLEQLVLCYSTGRILKRLRQSETSEASRYLSGHSLDFVVLEKASIAQPWVAPFPVISRSRRCY
jgi:hypothetical protein